MRFTAPFSEQVYQRTKKLDVVEEKIMPEHDLLTSLSPIGIVSPVLLLTLLLHPRLILLICRKRACTRVFQLSQQNTLKTILSVLSWAGGAYNWQLHESYGAWGPEVSKAFSQVATRLAIRGNTPKAKIVAELYGRLSLLLVRANARSILCRSYPQTPQQENELIT